MINNTEINKILEKLENLEDEVLAVELLFEFNRASAEIGKLLLNQDNKIENKEWKKMCDEAQLKLDIIINKINLI
jgi:hypothetical protein